MNYWYICNWITLKNIMLSETSQTPKQLHTIKIPFIQYCRKNYRNRKCIKRYHKKIYQKLPGVSKQSKRTEYKRAKGTFFVGMKMLNGYGLYVGCGAQLCQTIWDPTDCSLPGSSLQGVSQPRILERIFLTQGSNPSLLHCRQILYRLSHQV